MERYRPDLVDNCPNCGISFQEHPEERDGRLWNRTPVMFSCIGDWEGLQCMNCGAREGRDIIQEGYRKQGFFDRTYVPPVYGTKVLVFKTGKSRDLA